jgi:hypothetical protein
MRWSSPNLPVRTDNELRVNLGDIAEIERGPSDNTVGVSVDGKPAVEIIVQRSEQGDTLEAARNLASGSKRPARRCRQASRSRSTTPLGSWCAIASCCWCATASAAWCWWC